MDFLPFLDYNKKGDYMKIISKEEVAQFIHDNDTVAFSSSGAMGCPEAMIEAIETSYLETGHPKNITVTSSIIPGMLTHDKVGFNRLVKPGLVGKAICSHLGFGKTFGDAVGNNQFPTFTLPLGVMSHLYRAIGSGEIGLISHVGLHTFADPRIDGCCANEKAKLLDPIVELFTIENKETLFYKSFPIHVALLKGTYVDEEGNISLEHEYVIGEQYNMALAAHNSGGIVIVQVEEVKPKHSLKAKNVSIHSSLVDYVVVQKPDLSYGEYNAPIYKPELAGEKRCNTKIDIRPLDERKICGRRSAMELKKGEVINLGVGVPDSVSSVALEEGFADQIYLSVEPGSTGGIPLSGLCFGRTMNPDSIVSTAEQFDAYDGGSLDMAIVGLAEVDQKGNVNVSKLGMKVPGPGGFIDITQNTKKVIFTGTFTANGLEENIHDGKLEIIKEGTVKKFVTQVEQITFSPSHDQQVLFVTERAVFELQHGKIVLIEIAPGIDLQKDILDQMDFVPVISKNLKIMDECIFLEEKMNLKI